MEFPFGHNHSHTHHHHRNDDEENLERPPPPPYHQHNEFAPPPQYPPPPSSYYPQPGFAAPQPPSYHHQPTEFPPPPSQVTHVHHSGGGFQQPEYGSFNYSPAPAHVTAFPHHQPHAALPPELAQKHTVKVYCKADPNFHLTIRDGKVVLAPSDPSDVFQHWIKDEKFSTRVKDEVGFPSFTLVNKATGQAIKHSIGASHPVQLIPYRPDHLDESVLWSESKDTGDDYRALRMINNIRLNMDAFYDDKSGVRNGTIVGLWEWKKGDNQRWKIVPYCKFPEN